MPFNKLINFEFMILRTLKKNSTITVIAPAFPPVPEKTEMGITYLEQKGFKVKKGKSLTGNYGNFSATDEQRVEEINNAFKVNILN